MILLRRQVQPPNGERVQRLLLLLALFRQCHIGLDTTQALAKAQRSSVRIPPLQQLEYHSERQAPPPPPQGANASSTSNRDPPILPAFQPDSPSLYSTATADSGFNAPPPARRSPSALSNREVLQFRTRSRAHKDLKHPNWEMPLHYDAAILLGHGHPCVLWAVFSSNQFFCHYLYSNKCQGPRHVRFDDDKFWIFGLVLLGWCCTHMTTTKWVRIRPNRQIRAR